MRGFPSKGQMNRYAMRQARRQWLREITTRNGGGSGGGGGSDPDNIRGFGGFGCLAAIFTLVVWLWIFFEAGFSLKPEYAEYCSYFICTDKSQYYHVNVFGWIWILFPIWGPIALGLYLKFAPIANPQATENKSEDA